MLSAQQKALWEWIAAYYMCSAGEVMRVALPSLMKPSGDTEEEFAEDEFRPRTECYVALARELHDETAFHEACEKLERRAPKQYEALLELATAGDETRISTGEVARRLLRADTRNFDFADVTTASAGGHCPHCNVTLTYHKSGRKLVCHYCGYTAEVPAKCPSCKVTDVIPMGFGTEKVEEEIFKIFPEARVARLDRDSVTSEKAFNAIIADFEARKTDILVGTQMITKGFDFGGCRWWGSSMPTTC